MMWMKMANEGWCERWEVGLAVEFEDWMVCMEDINLMKGPHWPR